MSNDRIGQLQQFLEEDPEDSFTRYALSQEYISRGDTQKAKELLEDLRMRDPAYLGTYMPLARLYAGEGRAEDACAAYRAGVEVARAQGDTRAVRELTEELDALGD